MHVTVNRKLFFKMLKLTTDKKSKRQWLYDTTFIRIEANADRIRLVGKGVEAEFPAAVFTPGVLFIRARRFYEIMQLAPQTEELSINMRPDSMRFGDITIDWQNGDALLYLDPATAPAAHPEDRLKPADRTTPQTKLFDDL